MNNMKKPIQIGDISTDQITVIIQGAFDKKTTPQSIELLKEVLPCSLLILSTWEGTEITSDTALLLDEIVFSKDPGAVLSDETNRVYYNYNRQLVSTKNGLLKVKTKYALKIRSDMLIQGNSFLNHFFSFPQRDQKYRVFKERLIVSSMFTRIRFIDEKREYNQPVLHISDWVFFGILEDMILYFNNAELVTEPTFSNFFKTNYQKAIRCYSTMTCQFPPEQQLAISSFSKFFPELLTLNHYAEARKDLAVLSKNIILHNFIVLDPQSWPLMVNKKDYINRSKDIAKFSVFEFKTLYREHLFKKDYLLFSKSGVIPLDTTLTRHYLRPKIMISFITWKSNCFEESRLFYFHAKEATKFFILTIKGIFHV